MKKQKQKKEETFVFDVSSLNSRGQIVIPAKIRRKANLKKGDRLLTMATRDETIVLMKEDQFFERIKNLEKISNKIKLI